MEHSLPAWIYSDPAFFERERATVYMEGLAQMRRDWSGKQRAGKGSEQRAQGHKKKRQP